MQKILLVQAFFLSNVLNSGQFCFFMNQSPYVSALGFWNSPVSNIKFDELDFFPSLNWIFLPAVACKIQVWNRLKIKFMVKMSGLKILWSLGLKNSFGFWVEKSVVGKFMVEKSGVEAWGWKVQGWNFLQPWHPPMA